MKSLFAILTLSLSLSAIAQEQVLLNSEEVVVNASEAILVRTNKTPKNVKVSFRVPMQSTVCERYETRMVARTVMVHCGTDFRIQRFQDRVCTRRNPYNSQCLNWQVVERTERIPVQRMCPTVQHYPETYCAQYGTATSGEMDSMKLTFKKLPALGDSETDTFLAKAKQKSYGGGNVVWELTALQTVAPYKISERKVLGLFKTDGFKIEEK